uniref:Uncharacterized protein n=1 Tax=Pseudoalteromonas luteoviolacea TaxID=43657 RepID=A0A023Q0S3_9GAMM|nr:hypothetical protein [Pseudoalteromonas luteoviolacea]
MWHRAKSPTTNLSPPKNDDYDLFLLHFRHLSVLTFCVNNASTTDGVTPKCDSQAYQYIGSGTKKQKAASPYMVFKKQPN